MKTTEMFKIKQVVSFEVFPPKRDSGLEGIHQALSKLRELSPDFVSVTYGAGGSARSRATIDIAAAAKNKHGMESVAHLPCVGLCKEDVLSFMEILRESGIENILALRGDLPPGEELSGDFRHASDLAAFIRENGDFNIIGACYPEGHGESASIVEDLRNLRKKVDAGVSHLITQLFFDNRYFYDFIERTQIAGIDVPIEAGIMPVSNRKQIERMTTLCGVDLPRKFLKIMEKYEHSPIAMRDAGIAYAVDQIVDLLTQGVDGIHIYTMNNPYIAAKIREATATLVDFKPARP
jgi:methylenetetrahydrofolate reductase (NADPH)